MASKDISITFRTEQAKREALDKIAQFMDRDRSYVLNEAIENYLDLYEWQIREIEAGLAEADAGEFASDAEVEAAFNKWRS